LRFAKFSTVEQRTFKLSQAWATTACIAGFLAGFGAGILVIVPYWAHFIELLPVFSIIYFLVAPAFQAAIIWLASTLKSKRHNHEAA